MTTDAEPLVENMENVEFIMKWLNALAGVKDLTI